MVADPAVTARAEVDVVVAKVKVLASSLICYSLALYDVFPRPQSDLFRLSAVVPCTA